MVNIGPDWITNGSGSGDIRILSITITNSLANNPPRASPAAMDVIPTIMLSPNRSRLSCRRSAPSRASTPSSRLRDFTNAEFEYRVKKTENAMMIYWHT
ncbi:MAG: hypothetical protein BWY92_01639 [Firmicutes bacterium ADurb.BinA052]|nr:MAG: hypothetical protein BWY92_01639 [Firmicutes bacterium ADurb.BinA052]